MNLLKTRLPEILSKETDNQSSIYLYHIGEYWVAFEKSAYWLSRRYPQCNVCPLGLNDNSSRILMASMTGLELNGTLIKSDLDYKYLKDSITISIPDFFFDKDYSNGIK